MNSFIIIYYSIKSNGFKKITLLILLRDTNGIRFFEDINPFSSILIFLSIVENNGYDFEK